MRRFTLITLIVLLLLISSLAAWEAFLSVERGRHPLAPSPAPVSPTP